MISYRGEQEQHLGGKSDICVPARKCIIIPAFTGQNVNLKARTISHGGPIVQRIQTHAAVKRRALAVVTGRGLWWLSVRSQGQADSRPMLAGPAAGRCHSVPSRHQMGFMGNGIQRCVRPSRMRRRMKPQPVVADRFDDECFEQRGVSFLRNSEPKSVWCLWVRSGDDNGHQPSPWKSIDGGSKVYHPEQFTFARCSTWNQPL